MLVVEDIRVMDNLKKHYSFKLFHTALDYLV